MSQLILDEQLDPKRVLLPLASWITVQSLQNLRPGTLVRDERIPAVLLTLKQPTFVTIDQDFHDFRWCHPGYCILYFALEDEEQKLIPELLRSLLRRPEFRTRALRMGKIACIRPTWIEYAVFPQRKWQRVEWQPFARK
jgi:hypothetical protein